MRGLRNKLENQETHNFLGIKELKCTFFFFINFENPLYFWLNPKVIFTYSNGLESKKIFCKMFQKFNCTTKYIWARIPGANQESHPALIGMSLFVMVWASSQFFSFVGTKEKIWDYGWQWGVQSFSLATFTKVYMATLLYIDIISPQAVIFHVMNIIRRKYLKSEEILSNLSNYI